MAGNRVISAVLTLKDKDFGTTAQKSAGAMKDLERETRHSGNTVKNFSKSASDGFKKVATGATSIVAAIGVTKALSGAFNLVKSSIGSAFDRIDTMENFDRTMTALTGSTEQAKAALDATNEAVKGTAFGLDTAAKGVQDFVTRGMDVDKATSTIAAWGDAVSFYGDGSNEQLASVSDALAKMTSKGKVEMDQMNRLFDAGIDGVGMFAQATGRDAASVQKDLSSGAISAEDFIDTVTEAMMEGTNGVENIAGAAKEAGASWGASFGNMRSAVTRGVTNIIKSIDDMLTSNGLPDMRSMVAEFGGKFEEVLGSVSDKIPVATDFLVGMYDKAKPGIDWMKDTGLPAIQDAIEFVTDKAKDLYDFIKDNWSLIGPVVAGITATVVAFRVGIVAVSAATKIWGAVTSAVQIATLLLNGTLAISPLGWVALAIGAVVTAGILLWKNWDTIIGWAKKLWSTIKEKFGDLKTNVVNWFTEMKDNAVEKFGDIVQAAKDLPGLIGKGIKDFASSAWEGIKDLAKGLVDKFKEALGIKSPSTVFFDMGKWITEGLINGLSIGNLKDLGKNVFKDFAGGALNTLSSIKDFFTGGFLGGGGPGGTTTLDAIVQQIQSRFKGLRVSSTFRPGDPNDHGKGLALDMSGYGSSGGYRDVAKFASRLPGVTYAIGDNTVYGNKHGDGSMPSWAKGHMNHVHVSFNKGYEQGGRITSSGSYMVGEAGPERVQLPAGAKVNNAQNSKRMNDGGNTININISGVNKTVNEIVNELVPALKLRLANI